MATQRDYYEILGVTKTSSDTDIKSAYRKLALKYHPDRNKEADATEKFKEISQAYEVLSNPEKRKMYDQFGHAGVNGPAGGGGPATGWNPFGGAGGSYTYTSNGGGFEDIFGGGDPFDIFESFFGGNNPFRNRQPAKPHYSLKVDFMDAINGITKNIVHQGKEYKIKIPAGSDTGTRIRYQDFDISLNVSPHKLFKREGLDIVIDHHIPFHLAILGGNTTVETLDGDLKLKVRPGTQPNSLIRLTGKGVKDINSNHRGDFYIHFVVDIPTKISRKQKDLLNQFADN